MQPMSQTNHSVSVSQSIVSMPIYALVATLGGLSHAQLWSAIYCRHAQSFTIAMHIYVDEKHQLACRSIPNSLKGRPLSRTLLRLYALTGLCPALFSIEPRFSLCSPLFLSFRVYGLCPPLLTMGSVPFHLSYAMHRDPIDKIETSSMSSPS